MQELLNPKVNGWVVDQLTSTRQIEAQNTSGLNGFTSVSGTDEAVVKTLVEQGSPLLLLLLLILLVRTLTRFVEVCKQD
jgi:hypothetical protein